MNTASRKTPRRFQKFRRRSTIDGLPAKIRAKLTRLCRGTKPYREIRAWLKNEHGFTISIEGLSQWWRRREPGGNSFIQPGMLADGRVIVLNIPRGSEVRMEIHRSPRSVSKPNGAKAKCPKREAAK